MHDQQALALQWAIEELGEQLEELRAAAGARDFDRKLFSRAAHCVWWVAAIDNFCRDADPGYEHRRGSGQNRDFGDGRNLDGTIRGVIYLRDRMTYQVPVMATRDETPFFGSKVTPNAVFYLSAGIAWRNSVNLPPPGPNARDWRKFYDDNVAGMTVYVPLFRCLLFFEEEKQIPGTPIWDALNTSVNLETFRSDRSNGQPL